MSVTHFLLERRTLSFFTSARHSNGRLAWSSLNLQPYSFDIKYRCGRDNVKTNALSCQFEGDNMTLVDVDHCEDEDHCQYHLGIDHCPTGNRWQDKRAPTDPRTI